MKKKKNQKKERLRKTKKTETVSSLKRKTKIAKSLKVSVNVFSPESSS